MKKFILGFAVGVAATLLFMHSGGFKAIKIVKKEIETLKKDLAEIQNTLEKIIKQLNGWKNPGTHP